MMTMTNYSDDASYKGIHLFNESSLSLPLEPPTLKHIPSLLEKHEACQFKWVELVFVGKEAIVEINKKHLSRNYVTDIISFRYDEDTSNNAIEGTLYCCAPRIQEQAIEVAQTPKQEFARIIIHGLLHLVGYEDQSPDEKETMTQKENFYLSKLG